MIGNLNPIIPKDVSVYLLKSIKQEKINLELRVLNKKKQFVDVIFSTTPMFDESGNLIGIIEIITDISKVNKIKVEAEESGQ